MDTHMWSAPRLDTLLTTRAAQVDSAREPKRSEPMPAMSPTLSPTLSEGGKTGVVSCGVVWRGVGEGQQGSKGALHRMQQSNPAPHRWPAA
jgi:hypothetical protein